MQIQSDLPELINIKTSISGELYYNKSVVLSERIASEKNMFFKVKIDLETMIGQGSFGTIHPCILTLFKDTKIIQQVDNIVIKILRNEKCNKNDKELYKEVIIHCLIYNSANEITPKIYPYMMNVDAKTEALVLGTPVKTIKCYNGILLQNISNGSVHQYRNRLCNIESGKTPREILNDYFSMIKTLKDSLEDLYKIYKFKHNDLHCGNILFEELEPKIIDYGESTLNHKFSNNNLLAEPNKINIKKFYTVLNNEYEFMHKNYPLSDLHLYVFSSLMIFSQKKNVIPVIDISSEYITRLELIYSLTRLGVKNKKITFDGVVIEPNPELSFIYNAARRIIEYNLVPSIEKENVDRCWNKMFKEWDILRMRHMAFLYAIYLPDKINYDMFNMSVGEKMRKLTDVSLGNPILARSIKTIDYGVKEIEDRKKKQNVIAARERLRQIELREQREREEREMLEETDEDFDRQIREMDELMGRGGYRI